MAKPWNKLSKTQNHCAPCSHRPVLKGWRLTSWGIVPAFRTFLYCPGAGLCSFCAGYVESWMAKTRRVILVANLPQFKPVTEPKNSRCRNAVAWQHEEGPSMWKFLGGLAKVFLSHWGAWQVEQLVEKEVERQVKQLRQQDWMMTNFEECSLSRLYAAYTRTMGWVAKGCNASSVCKDQVSAMQWPHRRLSREQQQHLQQAQQLQSSQQQHQHAGFGNACEGMPFGAFE